MRAYIDSDVLIWFLRGERKAIRLLKELNQSPEFDLWIGALQRAEIVFFMRAEEEAETMKLLAQFSTAPVHQTIVDTASVFFRKWNPSHGVRMNDAILAGTVAETGGVIYCLNTKHYPMPEVAVERAW